jgi:hypothetical protein
MSKASPIQTAFNAGELSPRLEGRVDLEKYSSGCRTLENFLPLVQGGAMKRSGFRFVKEVKDSAAATRLIPFEFSTDQAYVLEFGNLYMRVYYDSGAALEATVAITSTTNATPVVVTATAHGYANGDQVFITGVAGATSLNAKYYTVANQAANTFELSGTTAPGSAGTGGTVARVFTLTTPYTTASLDSLYTAQSADVLYIASPLFAPRKLERTGNTSWTLTTIDFDWQPFAEENLDEDSLVIATAKTGTVTLISSAGIFESGHVGGYFALREVFESTQPEWTAATNPATNWQPYAALDAGQTYWYESNVYEVVDRFASTTHGINPPVHRDGTHTDGNTLLKYIHSGEGYALITAFTDANHVTASVVKQIPVSRTDAGTAITGTTAADPVVVTATAHGFETGDQVWIQGVTTADELNNRLFTITRLTANTFELDDEDGTTYGAGTGGTVYLMDTGDGAIVAATPRVGKDSSLWSFGAWSSARGFPRCVTFFEDRLWWASSDAEPQTLWASRTSNYEDHEEIDEDDGALLLTLNTDTVNKIEWLSAGTVLVIGTAGGEFVLSSDATGAALTANNVRAVRHSAYGTRENVHPVRIEQVVLFVQRAGRVVREFVFDDSTNSFLAPDLTVLADHIALAQIKHLAFQQEPRRIVWACLDDGQLIGLTYERAQEVVGWHRHPVGGTFSGGIAQVESIAVIPHPNGNQDQLWAIVKRTINSVTKRYIEFLEEEWVRSGSIEDAFFVDSGLSRDSSPTVTISGLEHLEGQTVRVLGDGLVQADKTVASGAITITSASVVHVGLAYDSALETMRFEAGARDGTAQGKTKRITDVTLRLDQTGRGLSFGPDADHVDPLVTLAAGELFDGDTDFLKWPGGYETPARVYLVHTDPLPCTVTAIMPTLVTQDRG